MNMKNPYKLVEKVNTAVNLYLSNYIQNEEFMIASAEEQKKINDCFKNFSKEFDTHQKILYGFNEDLLKILESLISENSKNSMKIKELESKIAELNASIESNNILLNSSSKMCKAKFKLLNDSVDKSISSSSDLINGGFADIKSEVKSLNDSVDKSISSNTDLINTGLYNQNNFNNNYSKKIDDIRFLLDSQLDINKNLKQAVDLFILNYNECKKCFFNDKENILKEFLDTDELFRVCFFNNIQFLSYSPSENRILLKTNSGVILSTNNRFYTIKEVIAFDGYSVPQLYQFDDFVVFDIGMNRAYASLRFAEFDNCSAVYGFEIDETTFDKAMDNINFNPDLSKKIHPFNFGLSNENKEAILYYLDGSDGVNTIQKDFTDIQYEFKDNKDKINSKKVAVKNATDVIENIIENENISSKIVLKIDTEGSEYDIVDNLIESGLIYKMDLIIGEGHKFNDRNLADDLLNCGFKKIEFKEKRIVYNFAFIKDEYYDMWPLSE